MSIVLKELPTIDHKKWPFVSRKRSSLIRIEDCVHTSIQVLKDYNNKKRLNSSASKTSDNTRTKKKHKLKTKKQKWEENNCVDISNDKLAKSHSG